MLRASKKIVGVSNDQRFREPVKFEGEKVSCGGKTYIHTVYSWISEEMGKVIGLWGEGRGGCGGVMSDEKGNEIWEIVLWAKTKEPGELQQKRGEVTSEKCGKKKI